MNNEKKWEEEEKKIQQESAAAWLLMKFLTTNVGLQANFSAVSGYAPVITGLESKNPAYAQALAAADGNANLQTTCVKQCINQESAMFVSPAFIGSSGARDQVGILMQNCFVNQPTAGQSSADFIKAEFEKAVAKLRYDHGA